MNTHTVTVPLIDSSDVEPILAAAGELAPFVSVTLIDSEESASLEAMKVVSKLVVAGWLEHAVDGIEAVELSESKREWTVVVRLTD